RSAAATSCASTRSLHDALPIFGMTFFVTALIGNALAARVEESEELARQRAIALSNLARLNERIVQHMQSGIVVLDDDLRVTLVKDRKSTRLNSSHVKISYADFC